MLSNQEIVELAIAKIDEAFKDNPVLSDWRNLLGNDVYSHSARVCEFALAIADGYEMNLHDRLQIAIGSYLHDIGKFWVNQDVLNKVKGFSKDDRTLVEGHPQLGYHNLRHSNFSREVYDIVHYHHERLDGSGYPELYTEKKISILTQIVSVADVYEALTADRVYHKAKTKDEAIEIMRQDKGLNQVAIRVLNDWLES